MILVYDIQSFEKGGGRIRSMAGTSIIETLFLFSKGLQESSVTIDISFPHPADIMKSKPTYQASAPNAKSLGVKLRLRF
jgi:hypothetical protein